jgi:hypothetical protein
VERALLPAGFDDFQKKDQNQDQQQSQRQRAKATATGKSARSTQN